MTIDLEPIADPDEVLETPETSAHIVGVASHSISTDGKTALVVFATADGGKFALTFPATAARMLVNLLHDIHVAFQRMGLPDDQMILHFPQQYDIGHSDQKCPDGIQGQCAITFDKGKPTEYTLILPNIGALLFAHQLENGVKAQLTEQERNLWREQMLNLNGPQRKLILPPGLPHLPPASS